MLASSVAALAEPTARTTIGASVAGETLGDGVSDGREQAVRVRRDFGARKAGQLGVSRMRRFGLSDTQISGSALWPMGEKLTASVDASVSGTHRVAPRHAVGGTLQYAFNRGWYVRGGVRDTRYVDQRVKQGTLALEHDFKDIGVTLAWLPTRAFGVTAHSYAVQTAWYYGERDSVNLTLATGREATPMAQGVVLGKVQAVGIGGRHAITPAWAASYGLSYSRQSELYTRKGLNVGLAYSY